MNLGLTVESGHTKGYSSVVLSTGKALGGLWLWWWILGEEALGIGI